MRVYKFRPISDARSLGRATSILATGKFWCSKFWELNDPMEGVYRLRDIACVHEVFTEKQKLRVCSFSHESALRNPLLWGYYASGFKGVAIEVETDRLRPVAYTTDLICPGAALPKAEQAEQILCNKLKPWEHEQEYRFLTRSDEAEQEVGRVISVVCGVPYPTLIAPGDEGVGMYLQWYKGFVKTIEAAALKAGLRVHTAQMAGPGVEITYDTSPGAWGE